MLWSTQPQGRGDKEEDMSHDCKKNRRNDPSKPFVCAACERERRFAHRVEIAGEIATLVVGIAFLLLFALVAKA